MTRSFLCNSNIDAKCRVYVSSDIMWNGGGRGDIYLDVYLHMVPGRSNTTTEILTAVMLPPGGGSGGVGLPSCRAKQTILLVFPL